MRLFADTSALFAALVRNDRFHAQARATLEHLLRGPASIVVTSYVILETLALLQMRVGLEAARRFEHELRPILEVTWIDQRMHERSVQRLELLDRRRVSLVDCSTFVAMDEVGVRTVFAYDEDFSEQGYSVIETLDDLPTWRSQNQESRAKAPRRKERKEEWRLHAGTTPGARWRRRRA